MLQNSRLIFLILPALIFSWLLVPCAGTGQSQLDSLKTAYRLAENDSVKANYGIRLSRQIHRENHDEEQEYYYAKEAINYALYSNNTLLYARALDNMGLLYRYHQQYAEAFSLHTKAFDLVREEKVPPIYQMIFANNAGVAARYDLNFGEAIAYYLLALRIAERENDLKNIAISSNGIGNSLGNIHGREEEALSYFDKALEAEVKSGDSLGIAMNYLSISDYYINKGEFGMAIDYLDKLLKINQVRNDQHGIAITYEFYGRCYLEENKDLNLAVDYYEKSLQRFKQIGDLHKEADILNGLGTVYLKQGQVDQAKVYFIKSLRMAQRLGHQGLIMQNSYQLSDIFDLNGNPEMALLYLKQGKLYEDSIKLSEQEIEIAALIRKYDLEKKENVIELLQKDKSLQESRLEAQQQQLNRRWLSMVFMGVGFLLVIAVVMLQYRNLQTKREAKASLEKEEQEKMKAIYERNLAQAETMATRLKINPHFLFNSLNAIKYLIQSEQNKKAMRYLVVFSRYTRIVLETSQKHIVPLTEELQLTSYYLTLEENRFENDFSYQIEPYDETMLSNVFVPPLLLQPFIENAVWHGLLPSKKDKKVLLIKIVEQEGQIQIIIDDNGVGRKCVKTNMDSPVSRMRTAQNGKEYKSMGMEITRNRIELFNKSNSSQIQCKVIDKIDEQGHPGGTSVILNIIL